MQQVQPRRRWNHSGESGPGLATFWSDQQVKVVISTCISQIFGFMECVELLLELLLMLLVLVSQDVQNGIRNMYDFDFVRWPLHFNFLPTPLNRQCYYF